jgi:hypothetical protein
MSNLEKLPSYETLLGHIKYHDVRAWLLEGAEREDAQTIRAAIKRLSDGQLNRRFARMLSRNGEEQ